MTAPTPSPIRWAALTCTGLQRADNEDAIVVGDTLFTGDMTEPVTGTHTDGTPLLLAVADGMGGHAAGERASRLVADGLARRHAGLTGETNIEQVLHDLNAELYAAMRVDRTTVGMGTTVAGVVVSPTEVTVFHVGDSRVYLASHDDGFEQATHDDVLAPGSGILTNCLGGESRMTTVDVHVTVVDRADVTAVAVCSDGLSDLVELKGRTLSEGTEPSDVVAALRDVALHGGAHDNISLVLAGWLHGPRDET